MSRHTVSVLLPDDQTLENLLVSVLSKMKVEAIARQLKQVLGPDDLDILRDELEGS